MGSSCSQNLYQCCVKTGKQVGAILYKERQDNEAPNIRYHSNQCGLFFGLEITLFSIAKFYLNVHLFHISSIVIDFILSRNNIL